MTDALTKRLLLPFSSRFFLRGVTRNFPFSIFALPPPTSPTTPTTTAAAAVEEKGGDRIGRPKRPRTDSTTEGKRTRTADRRAKRRFIDTPRFSSEKA